MSTKSYIRKNDDKVKHSTECQYNLKYICDFNILVEIAFWYNCQVLANVGEKISLFKIVELISRLLDLVIYYVKFVCLIEYLTSTTSGHLSASSFFPAQCERECKLSEILSFRKWTLRAFREVSWKYFLLYLSPEDGSLYSALKRGFREKNAIVWFSENGEGG